MNDAQQTPRPYGTIAEVFLQFLKLGCTSFGGPIAHIGYFRTTFVERLRWLNEEQFGQLLALCQFLPGPASSQMGFCLGLLRAGWCGALAAFIAFTLPSVILLLGFASALHLLSGAVGSAAVHGLKLVALAVVADAVMGMLPRLCPDNRRRGIALLAVVAVILLASAWVQVMVVIAGAAAGLLLKCENGTTAGMTLRLPVNLRQGTVILLVFVVGLLVLPLLASEQVVLLSVADAFYRAGALVFGGGHVVLPLLQEAVVASGWLSESEFLAGYGASQAIPGPLFAFSAYLGLLLAPGETGWLLSMVALLSLFLPGFLLVAGMLPVWQKLAHLPRATRAVAGVNAAVVGLLGAALYDPIFTSAVTGATDLAIALVGFGMLAIWRLSPLWVVGWCVLASALPVCL